MASSNISPLLIIPLLLVSSMLCFLSPSPAAWSAAAAAADGGGSPSNQTFRPGHHSRRMKMVRSRLMNINKPSVKTIQSPDGDIIDCVPIQKQPAFDHPLLKGQKPVDAPEIPKGYNLEEEEEEEMEGLQLWRMSGEWCPDGTVPIRRTSEEDILRASSVRRFGRKETTVHDVVRRDTTSDFHEHAVGYVNGEQYYGAKASMNVWAPHVANAQEFSLSQMWIISGSFGADLNTIEAGWQISPEIYGDSRPRFFTYWTSDAYRTTGCYNLLCSGFVQTNNRISIGAAISPTSSYGGRQFDITVLIWKDPKKGHWWLQFGSKTLVGYWPSALFTHLKGAGSMVQFGGEVVNRRGSGSHTTTQMGSGHFSGEGFGKASYFRNLQMVDWDNSLIPLPNLRVTADHPNCYDIRGGVNHAWGNFFFYGGPGRNSRCP
ncbi:unnamed protein product [Cuscuta campestris]|uniref:Neprosin PEP catalytic domain-containing protein n=1 Tax=Cuscuta campestris TaxID=132261 RepID=A0A484MFZ9_9ASTE|nr:unnamed protein product [Cuscuta campestris]